MFTGESTRGASPSPQRGAAVLHGDSGRAASTISITMVGCTRDGATNERGCPPAGGARRHAARARAEDERRGEDGAHPCEDRADDRAVAEARLDPREVARDA